MTSTLSLTAFLIIFAVSFAVQAGNLGLQSVLPPIGLADTGHAHRAVHAKAHGHLKHRLGQAPLSLLLVGRHLLKGGLEREGRISL